MIKLKDIVFRLGTLNIVPIVVALETITSQHRDLRKISFYLLYILGDLTFGEMDIEEHVEKPNRGMKWSDLDRLLVKLHESREIRTTVVCHESKIRVGVKGIKELLPEMMKRAAVDLCEEFMGPGGLDELRSL